MHGRQTFRSKTLGVESDLVIVLDALRKQRNLNDYSGDTVSDSTLIECVAQAEFLLERIRKAGIAK